MKAAVNCRLSFFLSTLSLSVSVRLFCPPPPRTVSIAHIVQSSCTEEDVRCQKIGGHSAKTTTKTWYTSTRGKGRRSGVSLVHCPFLLLLLRFRLPHTIMTVCCVIYSCSCSVLFLKWRGSLLLLLLLQHSIGRHNRHRQCITFPNPFI